MTDFNNINPDKKMSTGFNTKRQDKDKSPNPDAGNNAPNTPASDPYAELKTDPGKMLELMAAQGKQNAQGLIENAGLERAVTAFSNRISPERHAQVAKLMAETYQNETGKAPHPGLLQDLVDNYLIGKPVIQTP
jgi:hypothetical protein